MDKQLKKTARSVGAETDGKQVNKEQQLVHHQDTTRPDGLSIAASDKRRQLAEAMQEMNCRDCDNWLCGANGKDLEVLCFYGPLSRPERPEERHV